MLSMSISNPDRVNRKQSAQAYLDQVGIDDTQSKRNILKLSGGEQQRVGIARALAHNPGIIIADEPTGNLDFETEKSIMEIFKKLAYNQNKCVIIVTHSDRVGKHADVLINLSKINKGSDKHV